MDWGYEEDERGENSLDDIGMKYWGQKMKAKPRGWLDSVGSSIASKDQKQDE